MDDTHFEYKITSCPQNFDPYRAELTCGEVIRTSIILETSLTSVSLPEQTIGDHTAPIPLFTPHTSSFSLNCPEIIKLMTSRFGEANYSGIMSEIEAEIMSSRSRGRGVYQVEILRIRSKVSKFDKASEKLLTDMYGSDLTIDRHRYNVSTECVVCMEDYKGGSVAAILTCGHDFHGVCIKKWFQIKHQCPLCRVPISTSSPFSLYLRF